MKERYKTKKQLIEEITSLKEELSNSPMYIGNNEGATYTSKLVKFNSLLKELGPDPEINIKKLVDFCGQTLSAYSAYYTILDGEYLTTSAMWNAPKDFDGCVKAKGHIFYDVIQGASDKPNLITDLPNTKFADTDTYFKKYRFKTYLGIPVKWNNKPIGSLCVVYQNRYKPTVEEIDIFTAIASSIGVQWELKRSISDLEVKINQLQIKNRNEKVLMTVTQSIHRSLDLQEIFDNLVDSLIKNIDVSKYVLIFMIEGNNLVLRSDKGCRGIDLGKIMMIPYPDDPSWNVVLNGQQLYVPNVEENNAYQFLKEELGTKSYVTVPLKSDGNSVGCITIISTEVDAFDSDDLVLLEMVVQQIELAISNSRKTQEFTSLYEDLSNKNRDQEILNAITYSVHQSLDLNKICKFALDTTTELENIDMACIYLVDQTREFAVLLDDRNFPKEYIERAKRIPYPKGITWKVINSGEILNIEDAQKDPDIGPAGKKLGHHGLLGIPIYLEGEVIGVIWFLSYKEHKFSKREVDLFSSVGNQIAVAISKAKLYDDLSKRNKYENIIRTITESVHKSIDLQDVLENSVDAMKDNIESLEHVGIHLIEGDNAVMKAHRGHPDWFVDKVKVLARPKGFTWKTIIEGKLRYCPDVDNDKFIGPAGREVGTKSYASMPIKSEGKVVGVINVHSFKKEAFDKNDLNLLEKVANQIETAIKNANYAEALRSSEERYRSLFNQSPLGVYIFNKDLEITNCNDRMVEIIESSRGEIIGLDIKQLKDKSFNKYNKRALNGEYCQHESFYRTTTSSKEIWLRINLSPLRDSEGNVIGGMGVVEDITERKKTEGMLIESEKKYGTLYDQAPVGVFTIDKDLTIKHCNQSMVEIFQSSLDKIIGLKLENLEDKSFIPAVKRALDGKVAQYETLYKATTSSAVLWLSARVAPLRDAEGNVYAAMGVVVDISEQKNAEQKLKDSEEKYRTIIENTYDIITEVSSLGNFLYMSPNYKEVLGYNEEDLIGKNIFEYMHPDDKSVAMKEFSRAMSERTSGEVTYRYKHKNGHWKWFEATGRAFVTASGELRGVINSRDISERKKMEEELTRGLKLESLGVLAGGIAHDFNNLLTGILGNVTLSKIRFKPTDDVYKRLEEAEKASLRARDLTNQLLTFSKDGIPVTKVVSSIGELIKDAAMFSLSGSNVKCNFKIDEKISNVEIDEGQIAQVIDNLVINSQQAMPEGGLLNITVENIHIDNGTNPALEKGEYVKIEIEDIGIGISDEHLGKIFDPYFTTKQKGSGLGLSTVYSILKNHNGHIDVESKLGKGTKFIIYLPSTKKIEEEKMQEEEITNNTGRVLVMDDEEIVRSVAGEMLLILGYKVEFATDGTEALNAYKNAKQTNTPFDVVLMDLTIPGGMGGKETISEMLNYDSNVKVIVSSGYSNDPVMSRYTDYGFKGIVTKPYKIEELGRTIQNVIRQS